MNLRFLAALAFVVCVLPAGGHTATPNGREAGAMSNGDPVRIQTPPGLSPVHAAADHAPACGFISLGRRLDHDMNLSQERKELVAFPESPTGEISPGVGALV